MATSLTPQEALALQYKLTPEEIDRACRWAVIAKEAAKERAAAAERRRARKAEPKAMATGRAGPPAIKAVLPSAPGIWCLQCERMVSVLEGQDCQKAFCKAKTA